MIIVRPALFALVASLVALAPAGTHAQNYPSKPIKLLVPFPPGGPADSMSRLVSRKLGEALGQPLVLENRGGGGGTLAMEQLARSPADGYTLGIGSNSTYSIAPSLYRSLPYDPIGSFAHIGLIATVPTVLMSSASVPVTTLRELIDHARARPGQLNFGSNGNGTIPHLAGVLFQSLAGVQLVHVPYKGMGPAMNDLLAGQIQLGFFAASGRESQVREGKLRALAVASPIRMPSMPDVPTAAEAGLAGFEVYTWFGLSAPQGLNLGIQQQLHAALNTTLLATDLREALAAQGLTATPGSPEQFRAFVSSETIKWAPVAKMLGMKLD